MKAIEGLEIYETSGTSRVHSMGYVICWLMQSNLSIIDKKKKALRRIVYTMALRKTERNRALCYKINTLVITIGQF